jgi:hypothetical protein
MAKRELATALVYPTATEVELRARTFYAKYRTVQARIDRYEDEALEVVRGHELVASNNLKTDIEYQALVGRRNAYEQAFRTEALMLQVLLAVDGEVRRRVPPA